MNSATNFQLRRLKYVATINDEALGEDTDPDFEMQYIDIGNVDSNGTIHDLATHRFEAAPTRARRRVRDGDVIISTVRTYLQAIAHLQDPPDNLIVSTGFAVVRPRHTAFAPDFCKYALREPAFLAEVEKRSLGVSYPAINASDLGAIPLRLPPIPQQRAIADYLDRETGRLDALIAAKARLLGLLADKRWAIITRAVTRGLNPNAPLRDSGIPWLGEIPAHWYTPPVYSRFEVQLGKMLDEKRIKRTHLAPYLRNVDVQWETINSADLPEMDFDEEDRAKYALRPGDILVCEGGEVGRSAIWEGAIDECYYQKALHRLRPFGGADDPGFFVLVMRMLVGAGVFCSQAEASTIQHLPAEKLRVVRYPAPPISEQRAILVHIDTETAKLDDFRAATGRTIALLKERRAALIAAAVTGQIPIPSETVR